MNEDTHLSEPLKALAGTLGRHGLILRGGFHPDNSDDAISSSGTVLLVGNAGPALWQAFATHGQMELETGDHALDRWTRATIDPIADAFGCRAVYPFEGPPYFPFQAWAMRCDDVHSSPLGILIHRRYGLWHAYRAALLFEARLGLAAFTPGDSPCDTCADKPCLSTCPVNAFGPDGYDVAACAAHLRTPEGDDCMARGCRARRACPVGIQFTYSPDQARFHMDAFERARAR